MALVTLNEVLKYGKEHKIAIGSFSVGNLEMVMGAIKASEHTNTPIIIQVAEPRLKNSPLPLIGSMMVEGAKRAKTPICVHFDHGKTMENAELALQLGFTSVMFDGSSFDFETNCEKTKQIRLLADKYGADCEGEIGCLGAGEDGKVEGNANYTNPDEAVEFAKRTGIDAMAVAIGNAHGNYVGIPKLRFDILEEIAGRVNIPLVLHGGSGIPEEDFVRAKNTGVGKINIATASFQACAKAAVDCADKGYFPMSEQMVNNVFENVVKHIEIFSRK